MAELDTTPITSMGTRSSYSGDSKGPADVADRMPEDELISDEDALELVNKTYADYDHGRKPFERQWYRNVLFYLGNQWIIWDTLENKWRKKRLADWVPTPVTNKFASSGQRLVSVLSRIEPSWNYIPASDSTDDIAAAEQCEDAEGIICEENHIEKIRDSMSSWTIYTGNSFLLSGVEPIVNGQSALENPPQISPELNPPSPDMTSATSPLSVPDGLSANPPASSDENQGNMPTPAQDPYNTAMMAAIGMPVQQAPTDYKLYTDVLSPFEVYIDQTIENFDNQTKVMVVNRRSREYVKNLWGEDVDELDIAPNIHYQESIGYITSSPEITGFLASLSRIKRITVKRLFVKPTEKYPQGLYIVVAGSHILEKQILPSTVEGEPFIPVSQIKFDNIPGAAFGKTPMDDVVYKQIQRNKIESLMELTILRMGSPIWLMPEGTVMRNFTGQPGAIINYAMVGDKASKPDRIPGEQIPSSVIEFLALIDKDIEDIVSTFEALKGQSPYSGAPGVVIEQLIEQGLTRFGPSLRNVAEGYRSWMKHQLEFFRKYGIAMKTIMKQGSGYKWEAKKFMGADIKGAVDVRIESDSTVPRSSQVETAKILEAINSNLINIGDPNVRQKVLQKLKIQDLYDDIEGERIAAITENEMVAQQQPINVSPFLDNHVVHIYEHRKFAISDAGAPFKPQMIMHIAQHVQTMTAENTSPPPPPGVPGTGPARPPHPAGPGAPPHPAGPAPHPPMAGRPGIGKPPALNPGAKPMPGGAPLPPTAGIQ